MIINIGEMEKRNKYLCGVGKFIRSNKTRAQCAQLLVRMMRNRIVFPYEITVVILFVPYDILKLSYNIPGDPKKRSQ